MKSQNDMIKPGSLEGICLKCGTHRIGNALRFPQHQVCPMCGTGLTIIESGRRTGTGFSPFTAEKYVLNPNEKAPKSEGQSEE
jgi:hypothetical protein